MRRLLGCRGNFRTQLVLLLVLLIIHWLLVYRYHARSSHYQHVHRHDLETMGLLRQPMSQLKKHHHAREQKSHTVDLSLRRSQDRASLFDNETRRLDHHAAGPSQNNYTAAATTYHHGLGDDRTGAKDTDDDSDEVVADQDIDGGDDDAQDMGEYFQDAADESDHDNGTSVLSRAWIPVTVQTGAYTTRRWNATLIRALEGFRKGRVMAQDHQKQCKVDCSNVSCPAVPSADDDLDATLRDPPSTRNANSTMQQSAAASSCKTLWITGWLLEEACDHQALANYAVALASARYFAPHTLQPVVLLAATKEFLPLQHVSQYLQSLGVIVIQIGALSFQESIFDWHERGNLSVRVNDLVLPYWGLDVPQIVSAHGLFRLRNVCRRHVLFTNPNVLFVNPVTPADMDELKAIVGPVSDAFLMHDMMATSKSPFPLIYLMDGERFESQWPDLLEFRQESKTHVTVHEWLEAYFRRNEAYASQRKALSSNWNWHVNGNSGNHRKSIKIVHNRVDLINDVASCMMSHAEALQATCCDQGGSLALHVRNVMSRLTPNRDVLCPQNVSLLADDDSVGGDGSFA